MHRALAFLLCCLGLVVQTEALGQTAHETMAEVNFMDQPADSGGYLTRFLVTERYLRMDYGQDRDDFVLFDRRAHRIYNVTHDQREILVIEPGSVDIPKPQKWEVSEDMLSDERGKRTFNIVVNGTTCSRITASPNFLPDVTQALADFNDLMTATQGRTYLATPPAMRHPCDLARYVLDPKSWLKNGLPLYEADADGSIRRLVDYRTGVPVRQGVFSLPDTYRTIRMSDLQAGAGAGP